MIKTKVAFVGGRLLSRQS